MARVCVSQRCEMREVAFLDALGAQIRWKPDRAPQRSNRAGALERHAHKSRTSRSRHQGATGLRRVRTRSGNLDTLHPFVGCLRLSYKCRARTAVARTVVKFLGLSYDNQVTEVENGRASERVKVDAFVKVSGGKDREYVFRTRDLSEAGLFLYTKVTHIYPIKVGSKLALELYDYDESITCTVVVARVVEPESGESEHFPTGFGVRISDINDEDRARLTSMLKRLREGVAPY
jgi:hypothetical protein